MSGVKSIYRRSSSCLTFYCTFSCRGTPGLSHLTVSPCIAILTPAKEKTKNKCLFMGWKETLIWLVAVLFHVIIIWQRIYFLRPAAELTCTWAGPLRQCSRSLRSCICMQGALRLEPQWLQEWKPRTKSPQRHHNVTTTISKQPCLHGVWFQR